MKEWLGVVIITAAVSALPANQMPMPPATCPTQYYPFDMATAIELAGSSEVLTRSDEARPTSASVVW